MPLKEIAPDDMLARVLYRDGLMLILDKPAGLPVHRGPKAGVSLEDYFDALRFGLPRPPALAHRLDKDTSGCLVLGRHRKALAHLGLLFKHGKVGKTYWAVVEGGPDAEEGTVELSLGRLDERRGWWMKPDANGLPSVTTWQVVGRSGRASAPGGRGSGAAAPTPTVPRQAMKVKHRRSPSRPHPAHLARSHTGHWPHPPTSGSPRGKRVPDRRRQHLRNGAALHRPATTASCARGGGADLKK